LFVAIEKNFTRTNASPKARALHRGGKFFGNLFRTAAGPIQELEEKRYTSSF